MIRAKVHMLQILSLENKVGNTNKVVWEMLRPLWARTLVDSTHASKYLCQSDRVSSNNLGVINVKSAEPTGISGL